MRTIVTIVGARPQFVKAATVSRVIGTREEVREVIVHTGQHYDAGMSDVFFDELSIPRPKYHLGVGGGGHGEMTGRQLERIETLLIRERPDCVLVYGDTNSTLAGALAAAKLNIPVAHVEAGLRSFNRTMPEEINRVATDHMSSLLLAPTGVAVANLIAEGLDVQRIVNVGDVMYDAALFYRDLALTPDILTKEALPEGGYFLLTLHRAENTDDPSRLRAILKGLEGSPLPVVFPLHPRTRKALKAHRLDLPPEVVACDPVGYLEMQYLESGCSMVLTDSGGVQKEAYFQRKPCLTLRDETEWTELVEAGVNRLVSDDSERIRESLRTFNPEFVDDELYGRGNAAELIVSELCRVP